MELAEAPSIILTDSLRSSAEYNPFKGQADATRTFTKNQLI